MGVRALLPSQRIVNMFGAIGYSLLLISYALVASIMLFWLINNGSLVVGGSPSPAPVMVPEFTDTGSETSIGSILLGILAYTIIGIMVVTVVFVAVSLPFWLGKGGSYLMRRAIQLCRWSVTASSLLIGKLIACGVVIVPILMFIIQDMSTFLMLISVGLLVGFAVVLFLLQHYLVKMNNLEVKEIW